MWVVGKGGGGRTADAQAMTLEKIMRGSEEYICGLVGVNVSDGLRKKKEATHGCILPKTILLSTH